MSTQTHTPHRWGEGTQSAPPANTADPAKQTENEVQLIAHEIRQFREKNTQGRQGSNARTLVLLVAL